MMPARILIVEDQTIIALDLQARLCRLGYQVCGIAASGEVALQQVQRMTPDLILMDIMLKDQLDGIETEARLRADFHNPIVYVSAHSDDQTLQRASAIEPNGYILKPFDDVEIRSAIEIALYRHHAAHQLRHDEARFQSLIEHINDVILVVDEADQLTYASPAAQRLLDCWPANRLGDLVAELVAPEDVAAVSAGLCPGSGPTRQPGVDRRLPHSPSRRRVAYLCGSGYQFAA